MDNYFTDTLIEAIEENNDVIQFSIFDTPALSNNITVTLNQYKQVLDYLNLDASDTKFYDNELKTKVKDIYSGIILYEDILNYYAKYSSNLKCPELFSEDWCFLIAILLVEKNMFQRKHTVDPLYRIADFINAYLYEKALVDLPEFEYLNSTSNDPISFAKRDYSGEPNFRYKNIYTAEVKKYNKPYNKEDYQPVAEELLNAYIDIKNADYGVIVYADKTVVVFNTVNLQIDKIYTNINFKQIKMTSKNTCEIEETK